MRARCIWLAGAAGLAIAALPARADVTDDFEGGVNQGQWLGTNPNNTTIHETGGDPGGWLNALENMGEPLFQFLPDPNDVFAGDYAARGVIGLTVDLRADAGFNTQQPEGRGVTLRLYWTNHNNYPEGLEAYSAGPLLPAIGGGWQSYAFPIPATSATIPAGWTLWEGNGTPGTDADWQYLMHNVDQVQIIYGEIGYFFPIRAWNIGMDNVRLVTGLVGDLNCDGRVNFDDINPFVLALSDPAGYQTVFPNCSIEHGDCNADGAVNFDDINAFVALLTGS